MYKTRRAGIYDEHILCHECERKLWKYDTYAVDVYRGKKNAKWTAQPDGLRIAYWENIDRRLLRGFLASLLWRFSISQVDECKKVSIGSIYENRIARDLMTDGKFEYINSLTFILSSEILTHMVATPAKTRFRDCKGSSVNGYRLFLPGLAFYVSLDQRRHPLAEGVRTFNCTDEVVVGSMSLADEESEFPFVIPDIDEDQSFIAEILPVVASHKQNKAQWLADLINTGKMRKD